ncbi:MAG: efflux RND transporter periplasmic adaptor subunit [Lachnospiraceae bacterium]|nr:efflux RND transporter periplasmic adaptor subunit [Lachnospiraceae bacterium]
MKKGYFLINFLMIVASAGMLCGCAGKEMAAAGEKIVNATPVEEIEYETGLDYLGLVQAKDTKNYSFLAGGRLEAVYAKEGKIVQKGDPLAKLDTSSLEIKINTAKTNVNSLKSSVDTAKSALDAAAALHSEGYISDKEWEAQNSQYITLKGNYDMAVDTLKQAEKSLEESTLYAEEEGIVMQVPYQAGEVIGSGYPAAVLKSAQKMITVGVAAEDISKVSVTSMVKIDDSLKGTIDSIGQYPDAKTRTYPVDVIFESDQYVIGDMVDVKIITGKSSGCFVPVQSVFHIDGLDFVYMVDETGCVSRRAVVREELREDRIRVDGLEPGVLVINDGVKNIKENDRVSVLRNEGEKS